MNRLILAIVLLVLAGCGKGGLIGRVEQAGIASPDDSMEVLVAVNGDEGGTGDTTLGVYLIPKGGKPDSGLQIASGSGFSAGDKKSYVGVRWEGNDQLTLSLRSGRIIMFRNAGFVRTKIGDRFVGVRLDAPFFGPH